KNKCKIAIMNPLQNKYIIRAIEKATEISVPVSIALVDEGGHLLFFFKMEGCFNAAIDIAIKKAKTAAYTKMSTKDLNDLHRRERLFGVENSNNGMIFFSGGEPIFEGNIFIATGGQFLTLFNDYNFTK
ncbi:hypothetical protein DMUE_6329, partial [Dictyocoela muelleri]